MYITCNQSFNCNIIFDISEDGLAAGKSIVQIHVVCLPEIKSIHGSL